MLEVGMLLGIGMILGIPLIENTKKTVEFLSDNHQIPISWFLENIVPIFKIFRNL